MPSPLVIWQTSTVPNYCTLGVLQKVENEHEIENGISVAARFPGDAYYQMDERHPDDVLRSDSLMSLGGQRIVSAPLKDFLAAKVSANVEFLKVAILNHKGRVDDPSYYIVHPAGVIDCIDKDQSKLMWNNIKTDQISAALKLVLNLSAIPDDVPVFRPRYMPRILIIRRTLAEEMDAQKFTGNYFQEIEKFRR